MSINYKFLLIGAYALSLFSCTNMDNKISSINFVEPPKAEKKDSVLTVHNHQRVDPYFWMRLTDEQKNQENADEQTQKVLDYLNAENQYTKTVMASTEQLQEKLYDEMVGRIKKDDETVPYFKNGYWYYSRYAKGQEYPIYCRKKGELTATEEVILNVNSLAEGFEYYAVSGLSISSNNKILAFGEDTVSRRIYTIKFLNLETGEYLSDKIENSTGSGAWANDNKTYFFTTKDKVSLLPNKIWRHTLGNANCKDEMVYHEKDPSFYNGVYKSKSNDYIIIYNQSTMVSDYKFLDANKPNGKFFEFTTREPDHKYYINHFEDKFYIVTNWDAINFRLMETQVDNTGKDNWTEVIAHRADVLLQSIEVFKNYLVVQERSNALPQIRIINQNTKEEHYLEFDEEAYIASVGNNVDFNTNLLRFDYSSMTTPSSVIDYNMDTKEQDVKKIQEVVGGHNPDDYVTKRLYAKARDGEDIPVSLVYKKGFKQTGKAPIVLYGYGSYGNISEPYFSSVRLSLLDRGFVWAIAHVRGSQLKGRTWYEDGKMLNKKNTFTDFIDCADFLINEKYTSPEHLYALGGSAGGLLMGAIVNMAPEKFNGIVAAVPFVDVVSTMLDESIPLTTNEFDEWGNPKEKKYYDYMLTYSPYDQVKAHDYPHMLVTTGLFDSQVQYWEPAKWVAKLRNTKTGNDLLLMHTNMEAGHGGASGRFKRYKILALDYSFFLMLEGIDE